MRKKVYGFSGSDYKVVALSIVLLQKGFNRKGQFYRAIRYGYTNLHSLSIASLLKIRIKQ